MVLLVNFIYCKSRNMPFLTFLLIAAILVGCHSHGMSSEGKKHDKKLLPEFKIQLADSATYIDARNIPEGNPVVLFYFNPHCAYCRAQIAEITENMDALKGIRFYMITSFPLPDMKQFLSDNSVSKYQNITIGRDPSNYLDDYFKIKEGHYMAIYGKDKRLTSTFRGKVFKNVIIDKAFRPGY